MNSTLQYKSIEDDCVYYFDEERLRWRKYCDVDTLPISVKKQFDADYAKTSIIDKASLALQRGVK